MRAQQVRRRSLFKLISLAFGIGMALLATLPVSAHAELIGAMPQANDFVAATPTDIRLAFTTPIDPRYSTATLYSADHQRVDTGEVGLVAGNPSELTLPVHTLAKGVYTIVWTAVAADDGTATGGSFAFALDPAQAAPTVIRQPQPRTMLQPLTRVVPKWLAFVSIMATIGTLALRFLVWLPALKRTAAASSEAAMSRAVDRRLLLLAGVALLCFIPATVTQLVWEAANAAKHPFSASFDIGFLRGFLGTHGAGNLWAVRLCLTALAVAAVIPAAIGALRPMWRYRQQRVDVAMLLGLVFGLSELFVRTLPVRVVPGMLPRTVITTVLDWLHLVGASVWIGGLIGLVATASLLRGIVDERAPRLVAVIRQFSLVALVCVGLLTVSGLWTAWIHVGGLGPLFTTLYGRTLLIKLCLVLALVTLGAYNLFWLLPRIEAIREAGDHSDSFLIVALRHFRRAIAAEVAIGVAILLVVPFLAGSARNQAIQMRAADLSQTAMAGDLPVTLTPSALQPGLVNYDISLPTSEAARVTVGFSSRDLGIPETALVATAQGGGSYRISGMYTPIVGRWQAQVILQQAGHADRSAVFALPIAAKPVSAPPAAQPPVRATTWLYGAVEVAVIVLVLVGATVGSRRLSALRLRATADTSMQESEVGSRLNRRALGVYTVAAVGLVVLGALIWQGIAEHGAPPDPTDPEAGLSTGMVIVNSGILVFREGLETILVLAAVTASFLGANAGYRRPVGAGAAAALVATVITWFIVVAVIDAVNAPTLHIQAATGLLAIVVLLLVMNWFFHRVYWTGWIGHHQRRRKELLVESAGNSRERILLGVALLGFTSVYREGFEVVLFLQSLRLQAGTGSVFAGIAIGLGLTAAVGLLTFVVHHRLPYKKMLVLTGVMLAVVLVVMVGENIQEMQLAHWLPTTAISLPIPDWLGTWFAIFPNVEGLAAQVVAAALVFGSYFGAELVRVRLPRRRGKQPAQRPEQPPVPRVETGRQAAPGT